MLLKLSDENWKLTLQNQNSASFNQLQLAVRAALTELRDAVLPVVSSFRADDWLNTPIPSRSLPHLNEIKIIWNRWQGLSLSNNSSLPDILKTLSKTLIKKATSASLQDIQTACNQNPDNSFSTASNIGYLLRDALLATSQLHALTNKKSGIIWKTKTYLNSSDKKKWHKWLLFGDPLPPS